VGAAAFAPDRSRERVSLSITENLATIRDRITRAARRVRRDPNEVTVVAVTKTVAAGRIREAIEAGVEVVGENRIQEAQAKIKEIGKGVEWHLIGHLQTNKAGLAVALFDLIHSVDSLRLAEALNREAEKRSKRVPLLLQVNISGEESKFGVAEDEVLDLMRSISGMEHLEVLGLMTIPPYSDDPEKGRSIYKRLREIREEMAVESLPRCRMRHLSMGMSHDYEVAVEEGATLVRIGTFLFGERR
jgi:pyridoxal phosphate enzyme (YggS family)